MNRGLLIILLISLTGCFEVVEEVDLNTDGSGTYKYTLNLSQSKEKLDGIMLLDSVNGYPVPQKRDIENAINEFVRLASSTEGIRNVEKVVDMDHFIFNVTLDFNTVDALNRVLNELQKRNKVNTQGIPEKHVTYDVEARKMTRFGRYPIKNEFEKMSAADKMIFDGAKFVSVLRSEAQIVHFSNKQARRSPNKKALLLECEILDLLTEKVNLGNTIQFQP